MNLYIVNVIIPNSKTLTTRVVAANISDARRLAVTNCPQAKGTLAYGEVVRCFPPVVGMTLPSTTPAVNARRSSPGRDNAKTRRSARRHAPSLVAPVTAKRIPACPGRAFSPDDMSMGEAMRTYTAAAGDAWLAVLQDKARQVAAEVAADIDAELHPTTDSNFMVGVVSAYHVESGGWDGWRVGTR